MTYRMRSSGLPALPLWIQRLGLSLVTASTLTLVACGGGGGNDATPTPVSSGAPPSLQSVSTDEQTSVSVSTSTSTTTGTTTGTTTQVMRTAALDFEGKVNAGPSKGTELKGKLQLNAKSTDGGKNFDVTGKLIQRSSMTENDPQLTDAQKAQINAALKKFYDGAKVDYEKFRLGVSALTKATDVLLKVQREAWAAVPAKAPDAAAQYQAITDKVKTILDDFNKQLDTLQSTLTKDLKALNETLLAEIKAIKPDGTTSTMADITVTGTLTQDGKITLTFDLGGGAKIVGTGQSDAKGKYTGAFTGPASGDIGTWSANPILCEPIPPTVPGTTTTMPTPTGTMPTPTGTVPGTTTTTTTTPNPTSTVPTTPTGTGTVTIPGADTCSGRIAVGAEISEVISASVIKVGKGISIGQYENGIPFDVVSAKLVGGTAADFKVGKWVQVCSDDTISAVTASSPPPLKASTVIFK
jgi:hypothetical protein